MELNTIYNEDCLEGMKRIPDGSVDLIVTDPPYGTVKGLEISGWEKGKVDWDNALIPKDVFGDADRILRKNGKLILFGQEPYTSELIKQAIPNLPFSYRLVWEKDHFANGFMAKKAPVNYYEDVLIFSKTHDREALHPLREYATKVRKHVGYSRTKMNKELGHGGAQHFLESNKESTQFTLCTEKTYNQLIDIFNIDEMEGFRTYKDLLSDDTPSIFNLWQGKKHKSNILKYKKDYEGLHPTQKPVLLIEDLIKTYSNEGDTVLDFTMGSGTTAIACLNTNRKFIGFELDTDYHAIALERIAQHERVIK